MGWSSQKKLSEKEYFAWIDVEKELAIIDKFTWKENTQENMPYQCRSSQYAEKDERYRYPPKIYAISPQK
jgi:hypothetical protein